MAQAKYSPRASGIIAVLSDKPVAYHPALAKQVGVKEAIFLCQLLYWDGRGKRPDGWIWKCQKEMTDETGLSRTEQETVRKHLIALGVMEEKLMSIPATMHFKIDFEKLAEIVERGYANSSEKPRNQVCRNHANLRAETPQSIPESTSENTTENIMETTTEDDLLLSCSNEHDNTLAEYSEATTSSEGTSSALAAIPSLELDPATLNVAANRCIEAGAGARPKATAARRRDNSAVAFSTPGAAYMVELYVKEGAALHRSAPGKFPSLTAKERFEAAEAKLGLGAFKKALVGCFTSRGYPSIAQVIGYVEKVQTNGNGNGQDNTPAKSTLPPLLFQKVAEAIRYDPEAQEHIPRISRLTETCQQRGYTEEQIRKAGKIWWETWPGEGGRGPTDAEFLQKIVIVKKERI